MISWVDRQRSIARLAFQAAGAHSGFALAGSGAIREHGLIDRPTEDVDLFTVQSVVQEFGPALDRIVHSLHEAGYKIDARMTPLGTRWPPCSPAVRPVATLTWTASAARASTRTNSSSNSPNTQIPVSTRSGSQIGSQPSTAFNSARSSRTAWHRSNSKTSRHAADPGVSTLREEQHQ